MAYLHENRQTFNAAVARTADQLRINPAIVAKDYFVYVMLKEIVLRYPSIVFKGGTCLSKCHKVINRFSEDIDLGVETEQLSRWRCFTRCVCPGAIRTECNIYRTLLR